MTDEDLVAEIEKLFDGYSREHEQRELCKEFWGKNRAVQRAAWHGVRTHLESLGYVLSKMNKDKDPRKWSLDFLQRVIGTIRCAESAATIASVIEEQSARDKGADASARLEKLNRGG